MTMGLGAYHLRKAIELGDLELLKEVLSSFLSEKPVKLTKIKPTEVISAEDLSAILLYPVPGDLLYKAAKNDKPEMLDILMKGINQAVKDPELNHRIYRSAIHWLEEKDDAENIRRFVNNGYQPDSNDLGRALFQSYKPKTLQVYIDSGAVERSGPVDLACIWLSGSTRNSIPQEERKKILAQFISHGMDIKNDAILYHVIDPQIDWSKEPFQELIEAGAPIVTGFSLFNPMHKALDSGNPEAAKILIENTPPEGLKTADLSGATLLMKAASAYYPISVKPHDPMSVESHDPMSVESHDPMSVESYNPISVELVDMLVQKGADVNAVDKHGRSALMYVRDQKTAEALIKLGANVAHKDNDGRSVAEVLERQANSLRNRGNILRAAAYVKECAQGKQPQLNPVPQKQGGRG